MDTGLWCPRDAKVGVRIGTNSDTKFGVLGTLTVFTVYTVKVHLGKWVYLVVL